MVKEQIILMALWAALGAIALGTLGEWLHARRMRRIGRLAFGPGGSPRKWTIITPFLRVAAFAALAWSLVVLIAFDGSSRHHERNVAATRHLMILLDVSPSMGIADAGDDGQLTRRERAALIIRNVMERANSDKTRMSMACFYSDAMMLARECSDRELIWNFAHNLPLHMAYKPGKTSLMTSLNTTGGFLKNFPRKSVTLLVLTDGDTVPDQGLKPLPSSVAELLIVGVGNAGRGTFIDGHLSRQDNATMSQLARRLGGNFFDGNVKQVPTSMLNHLTNEDEGVDKFQVSLRTLAVMTLAGSVALICLLSLLLEYLGSAWKAVPAAPKTEAAP